MSNDRWQLIEGDCLDVMATLEQVDHVISDPPYSEQAHSAVVIRPDGRSQRRRRIGDHFGHLTDETMTACAEHWARLSRRWDLSVLHHRRRRRVASANALFRYEVARGGVWHKPAAGPQLSGNMPGTACECIAIGHSKSAMRWNGGGTHAFWSIIAERDRSECGDHPTPKPVALMCKLVELFTDPGEVVLDPFAGTGTTGVACLRLGRRFIGIERDPKYAAAARTRLEAAAAGLSVASYRAGQQVLF